MISINEWRQFPLEIKNNIISMVYGSNIKSEIDIIKNNILNHGDKELEIIEYITPIHKGKLIGSYYEIKALIYVSNNDNIQIDKN